MILGRFPVLALVVTTLALALAVPAAVHAEEHDATEEGRVEGDSDHDRARDLLESGEIEPLSEIIARLAVTYPGEFVGISLARKQGRWVYEFEILAADGRRLEVSVDAKKMNVIPDEDDD